MPLRPALEPHTATGRATIALIPAGLPGWGTYALLCTTALADGQVTATLAATDPADLDLPRPYGNPAAEKRSLRQWAEAVEPARRTSESQPAYDLRIATYLARTGHAARLSPASLDLPHATWEVDVDHALTLTTPKGAPGYAGHHQLRIGRLTRLTVENQIRKETAA